MSFIHTKTLELSEEIPNVLDEKLPGGFKTTFHIPNIAYFSRINSAKFLFPTEMNIRIRLSFTRLLTFSIKQPLSVHSEETFNRLLSNIACSTSYEMKPTFMTNGFNLTIT